MATKHRNRREIPQRDVYRMETQLGAVLHGVKPRPDFVTQLRTRLAAEPIQAENNRRVFQYVILALAGIVSGVLLVIAVLRGVSALLSFIGIDNLGRRNASLPLPVGEG